MPKTIKSELHAITQHIKVILCRKMTGTDKAVLKHLAQRRSEILNTYKGV